MILNRPEQTAGRWVFLQTNASSYRRLHLRTEKVHFPAESCNSLQKMHFPAEKCSFRGHMAGNRRKAREGFRAQESRTIANFHKTISVCEYWCCCFWLLASGHEKVWGITAIPKTNAPGIILCKGALTGQSSDTPQSNSPNAIDSEIVSRLLPKTARYCNCNG